MCLLSPFSHFRLFEALWTVAHQGPLFIVFSWQAYWSGLPCLPLGDLHHRGNKSVSLMSPALVGGFFTTSTTWKPRNESTTQNLKKIFLKTKKNDWNIVYSMYFTYSSNFSHHLQRQSSFSIFGKEGIFECPFLTCHMATVALCEVFPDSSRFSKGYSYLFCQWQSMETFSKFPQWMAEVG